MRVEDFTSLMEFFLIHNTLKVSQEDVIMEVFNYSGVFREQRYDSGSVHNATFSGSN